MIFAAVKVCSLDSDIYLRISNVHMTHLVWLCFGLERFICGRVRLIRGILYTSSSSWHDSHQLNLWFFTRPNCIVIVQLHACCDDKISLMHQLIFAFVFFKVWRHCQWSCREISTSCGIWIVDHKVSVFCLTVCTLHSNVLVFVWHEFNYIYAIFSAFYFFRSVLK